MVYALNDLKMLPQNKLNDFFSELLCKLGVNSYFALTTLEDNTQVLEVLKGLGLGIDDKTPQNASLLHYAASAGLIEAVLALRRLGYAIENTTNGAGLGHYAALAGHILTIKNLVTFRLISIHAKDNDGAGLILYAARGGHIDTIQSLMELGLNQYSVNNMGAGVIHYAVSGGQIRNLDALVDLGYSVHLTDRFGNTALHLAARLGRTRLIRLLIEKYGLNPEKANHSNQTIYNLALESQCPKTITLCLNKDLLNELHQNYLLNSVNITEHIEQVQTALGFNSLH